MLRVGVVGMGAMGATHADILRTSVAGATLAAVSDPNPARTVAMVEDRAVRVFKDVSALIGSDEVDAVVIASPDDQHRAQVLACLDAGKPVLCEKPLADTVETCRALVEQERSTGRRLVQVGYMRRFDPAYVDLKSSYDSGAVGAAVLVRCSHRNATAPSFFRAGMAISNAMVHEFDICRWLLGGQIEAVRVDRPGRGGQPADDPLLATVRMSGGPLVSIEVFMNATYGYDIGTEIVGENGVLAMGTPALTRRVSASGGGSGAFADFRARFAEAYLRQMQDWVRGITSGTPCGAGAPDGLEAALAAEAAVESLRTGDWQRVEARSPL